MDCKFCGSPTKVVDSRSRQTSKQRRRECTNCHARFSTIEIDLDVYESMTRGHVTSLRMDVCTFPDGRQPVVNYYEL